MRGSDTRTGELFSYIDLEDRVPAKHPLREIRRIVNYVLTGARRGVREDLRIGSMNDIGEMLAPEFCARAMGWIGYLRL